MGIMGYKNIALSGTSTASYTLPTYIDFYLMLDVSGSMSFPSTTAEHNETAGRQSRQLQPLSKRLHLRMPFHLARGLCAVVKNRMSAVPPSKYTSTYNPSPGGYCQGFTITRLGTTPGCLVDRLQPSLHRQLG